MTLYFKKYHYFHFIDYYIIIYYILHRIFFFNYKAYSHFFDIYLIITIIHIHHDPIVDFQNSFNFCFFYISFISFLNVSEFLNLILIFKAFKFMIYE